MLFLAVTAGTWLVTGLGFGIVLVLLCLFVFVMKGQGALMQWIEAKAGGNGKAAAPVAVVKEEKTAAQTADDLVAVAYALHLFYGLHDIDAPRLTLHPHHSTWNEHTFGINNLDR